MRTLDERQLIEQYVDPDWDRYPGGRGDARLRDSGVPIWALVAHYGVTGNDRDQLARDYQLPRSAIEAALAFYEQNKEYIDARILLNSA